MTHPHETKPWKKQVEEEVDFILSPETLVLLEKRRVKKSGNGCFLCSMILRDQKKNGKLTDYPIDNEKGMFPVDAKLKHIELEKGSTGVFDHEAALSENAGGEPVPEEKGKAGA